jgi:uncharacterized membrane-anchored protein YitT (DUF2179 family)
MSKIKKGNIKKGNILIAITMIIFIIISIIIISNWAVIFQKGNPIPYIKAILQLNREQSYIQVENDESHIFITKRANYEEFHEFVKNKYDVSFVEQMGSGYLFSSDENEVLITSEVYLKYYIVWTVVIK